MTKSDLESALSRCRSRIREIEKGNPDDIEAQLMEVRAEIEDLRAEEERLEKKLDEARGGLSEEEEDELDALREEKKRLERVLRRYAGKDSSAKVTV